MTKLIVIKGGATWNNPLIPASGTVQPKKPPRTTAENPGLGYITFVSYNPQFAFTCLLGDGTATPTGGFGGWNIVSRARRRGLIEWVGNDPLKIEIPLIFDAFAEDDGLRIEKDIRALEKMAGLSDDIDEPPLLTFNSGGVVPHDAHDASQTDWVITDLVWGDADRNIYGNRVRQAATVTVTQHISDDALTIMTSAQRNRKAKHKKDKKSAQKKAGEARYVVKAANETLESVAAKKLHDHRKWRLLRKLNPRIKDPKKILPIGTVIKLK